MSKEDKNEMYSRIFSIIMTLTFLVFITWFWFGPRRQFLNVSGYNYSNLIEANSNLAFLDLTDGINLENAYPVSDSVGLTNSAYSFQIENKGTDYEKYKIQFCSLEEIDENVKILENKYLRFAIKKNNEAYTIPSNLTDEGTIFIDSIAPNETSIYSIKMWIDQDAGNEIMNSYFYGKINVVPIFEEVAIKK